MSDLKPQTESLESLLSTAIGLLMGHKERIGYKPNSVIAKFVAECVERLKDWPMTTSTQPAQAVPLLTEREIVKCLTASGCVGTVKMSYDSGPHEITRTSVNADRLARAIEQAVHSKLGAGVGWQPIETAPPDNKTETTE